ncbi:hypothetical protein [uncultured Mucilaginibacter sp.]|uniref:hypothetical protein n=1 Tax=uncultured Mucilaginibacter sp. TaxID=797541 RepID=UPI0025F6280B|nr:hypothetical protein [uncultured Mucilaginibacter sp.]
MSRKNSYQLVKTFCALFCFVACMKITSVQAQVLSDLQNSFSNYQKSNLKESIYLHINKSTYLTGEIIWFKVYCVEGGAHTLLNLSKVVYVEILDNNHAAVVQTKIRLNNGTGNGSIYLPFSINSGNYQIQAYTNWMKNFSAEYFFMNGITIVNPLKAPVMSSKPTATAYDVQFFPEGGHLVQQLKSKVAFKITGTDGKGQPGTGAVIDQKNDTVVRFSALKFGIGSFNFKPLPHNVYRAVIKLNQTVMVKELPAISESGYVMQATAESGNWNVRICNSDSSSAAGIYLIVHSNQTIALAEAVKLVNGAATFSIDNNKLEEGVNHITLFDDHQRALCERLVFKRPEGKLMINAHTDAQTFSLRKNVKLTISAEDQNRDSLPANLSVSVYKADALQIEDVHHISAYLWLQANLKGRVESPDFYFDDSNKDSGPALDNLMLSQGWTEFNWNKILANRAPDIKFLPEYEGHIITGRITRTTDNTNAGQITAYLSIPGTPNQLFIAKSDSTGNLLFNTQNFFGPNEIIIQTNSMQDSTYHIEVSSPFSEQHSTMPMPILALSPDVKKVILDNSLNMQVQNTFAANQLKQFYSPQADSMSFYGTPTKRYKLDDYTRFTTMEEVLREYVTSIAIVKHHGKFGIRMFDVDKRLSGEPMILLDCVPVFDADKIFKLDPLKVRQLDVIARNYLYGIASLNGIMSFTTYKGDGINFEIDPHAVVLDYEGLQLERKFYSPVYDSEEVINSPKPDFRSALYWNPDVITGHDGKATLAFYTSDKPGTYIGIIEGITASGKTGSQQFYFEVKK